MSFSFAWSCCSMPSLSPSLSLSLSLLPPPLLLPPPPHVRVFSFAQLLLPVFSFHSFVPSVIICLLSLASGACVWVKISVLCFYLLPASPFPFFRPPWNAHNWRQRQAQTRTTQWGHLSLSLSLTHPFFPLFLSACLPLLNHNTQEVNSAQQSAAFQRDMTSWCAILMQSHTHAN